MSVPHLPFQLSASSDDADPDAKLLMFAGARRAVGEMSLEPDGVSIDWEVPRDGEMVHVAVGLVIPYALLASAVLRRGILSSRLRVTALRAEIFARLNPRSPHEATFIISRRYRHEARAFVADLQIRIAESRLPDDARPDR